MAERGSAEEMTGRDVINGSDVTSGDDVTPSPWSEGEADATGGEARGCPSQPKQKEVLHRQRPEAAHSRTQIKAEEVPKPAEARGCPSQPKQVEVLTETRARAELPIPTKAGGMAPPTRPEGCPSQPPKKVKCSTGPEAGGLPIPNQRKAGRKCSTDRGPVVKCSTPPEARRLPIPLKAQVEVLHRQRPILPIPTKAGGMLHDQVAKEGVHRQRPDAAHPNQSRWKCSTDRGQRLPIPTKAGGSAPTARPEAAHPNQSRRKCSTGRGQMLPIPTKAGGSAPPTEAGGCPSQPKQVEVLHLAGRCCIPTSGESAFHRRGQRLPIPTKAGEFSTDRAGGCPYPTKACGSAPPTSQYAAHPIQMQVEGSTDRGQMLPIPQPKARLKFSNDRRPEARPDPTPKQRKCSHQARGPEAGHSQQNARRKCSQPKQSGQGCCPFPTKAGGVCATDPEAGRLCPIQPRPGGSCSTSRGPICPAQPNPRCQKCSTRQGHKAAHAQPKPPGGIGSTGIGPRMAASSNKGP
ncbi:proteoglycan 4-like [Macrobrachium nipponense]|uniref:proteoglycan 4-like n=1 Tax=Macrobrachium nipponense TaxID=159736 RepID=UPI0030C806E0